MAQQVDMMNISLADLVKEQVKKTPDSVAVIYDEMDGRTCQRITYSEMCKRANKVFQELQRHDARNEIVGVCIEPSINLPSILLGIMRASSSYFPFGVDGLGFVKQSLQKLGVSSLLLDGSALQTLRLLLLDLHVKIITTEELQSMGIYLGKIQLEASRDGQLKRVPGLAYCITTSGTTGTPKVVRVPHSCIVPNIVDFRKKFKAGTGDITFFTSPLTFDPSVIDIFMTLTSGAALLVVPAAVKLSGDLLLTVLSSRHRVTILQITPSLFRKFDLGRVRSTLLGVASTLKVLAFGGEAFPSCSFLDACMHPENRTTLYNVYGITEVSCWATVCCARPPQGCVLEPVPIGEALTGTRVKVVDAHGVQVQTGVGHILIGGSKRTCLLNEEAEWVLLRGDNVWRQSGDLGEVHSDGNIYCLGRDDRQIKRHGRRLNLDTLEKVVCQLTVIEECRAIHREGKLLLFCRTPSVVQEHQGEGGVRGEVRSHVTKVLPNQYHPDEVMVVPAFPISLHGKLDTASLLQQLKSKTEQDQPAFNAKSWSQKLWQDTLGSSSGPVSSADSFLASGGDSLKAVHLVEQVEHFLGHPVPELLDILLTRTFGDFLNFFQLKSTLNKQKSFLNKQESDVNKQESDVSKQVSDVSKQLSDVNKQVSDVNKQVSDVNKQVSDVNKQVSDVKKQESDVSKQVSDVNKQESDENKQVSDENKQESDLNKQELDVNKLKSDLNVVHGSEESEVNGLSRKDNGVGGQKNRQFQPRKHGLGIGVEVTEPPAKVRKEEISQCVNQGLWGWSDREHCSSGADLDSVTASPLKENNQANNLAEHSAVAVFPKHHNLVGSCPCQSTPFDQNCTDSCSRVESDQTHNSSIASGVHITTQSSTKESRHQESDDDEQLAIDAIPDQHDLEKKANPAESLDVICTDSFSRDTSSVEDIIVSIFCEQHLEQKTSGEEFDQNSTHSLAQEKKRTFDVAFDQNSMKSFDKEKKRTWDSHNSAGSFSTDGSDAKDMAVSLFLEQHNLVKKRNRTSHAPNIQSCADCFSGDAISAEDVFVHSVSRANKHWGSKDCALPWSDMLGRNNNGDTSHSGSFLFSVTENEALSSGNIGNSDTSQSDSSFYSVTEKEEGRDETAVRLQLLWSCDTGKCVDASPLVARTRSGRTVVFIGSHSHWFFAIDLMSGKALWSTELGDRVESSACLSPCGTRVVVGCYDQQIYWLKTDTGEVDWQVRTGDVVKCSPVPHLASPLVFCGSHDGHLYALHCTKRRVEWKSWLGGGGVFASPVLSSDGSTVYTATLGGHVTAVSVMTGTVVWCVSLDRPVFSSPALQGDRLFVACVNTCLYCLSSHTGLQVWSYRADGPIFSSPAITERSQCASPNMLFGCHDNCLHCVSHTGQLVWKHSLTATVFASPFVFCGCHKQQSEKKFDVNSCLHMRKTNVQGLQSNLTSQHLDDSCAGSDPVCEFALGYDLQKKPEEAESVVYHTTTVQPLSGSKRPARRNKLHNSENGEMEHALRNGATEQTVLCCGKTRHSMEEMEKRDPGTASRSERGLGNSDCEHSAYCGRTRHNSVETSEELDIGATPRSEVVSTVSGSGDSTALCEQFVACVSTDGQLSMLSYATGELVGHVTLPGEVFSSPVIVGDRLVVGCRDDRVYCYKLNVL